MPELSKTRTVMEQFPHWRGSYMNEDRSHIITIDPDVWTDMGEPQTITVTIEPGDKLNGDPE